MNLMSAYPSIANDWHPSLNGFSPLDVAPHSHKRAWWKAPADKVFVAKKVTLHLTKRVMNFLQKFDSANRFSESISSYLSTQNFQNSTLFKTTYDAMRKCI